MKEERKLYERDRSNVSISNICSSGRTSYFSMGCQPRRRRRRVEKKESSIFDAILQKEVKRVNENKTKTN